MDGLVFMEKLREQNREAEVVILTGFATIETAVRATKLGAYDYLQKPVDMDALLNMVDKIPDTTHEDLIVAFVREHYPQIRCREEVAHHFRIDPTTVSDHVRRSTGQCFRDLLESCRIREAQRLLAQTDLAAIEISARVGFSSYHTFSRALTRSTGYTPRQYRQSIQSTQE